ncbi:LPXTG cell wall anchor domain-containing protein [Streptomyces pseudogriseolus]|uniref:LPXTG cell wall anchor domain-containing protein n=1 Tax=Streptomyces pseudogriseolus TaxID=36817 RepID=UPI001CE24CA2|nr:LPXTG cell wall anchor domain-containing protein [Streptomyces pseudogriseolus]
MSSALRPLLTATAAGTLLCALWFVPSANATSDAPATTSPSASPSPQVTEQARGVSSATTARLESTGQEVRLADTGSFDSTPYIIGGTASLALGAGFVVYSVRRERLEF